MSPRGGRRPNTGPKPTTGRSRSAGGSQVAVMFSQDERGRLEAVLEDDETAAGLLRDLGLAEVKRRERVAKQMKEE